ncbi:putative ribonuclease H-like domain-containing protein, partial [Tanacetum coccineum]
GKQHKASCKSKIQNSVTQPLFMLHMDLFGPTFVSSLMNKKYCLVVTDDYSRFTWVFFLASKDETSGILKNFITEIENLVDKKVKIIRCDNGTEFKNRVMNEFCKKKVIKREFSVARTPQQNSVAERRNGTLIEAARTMLADSKLPTTLGRNLALSFMRPFGCHVTILNTLDHHGKFDGKSDDGFFVGYSLSSDGPKWLFDIDSLTKSMNYVLVVAGTNSNDFAGSEESNGAGHTNKETEFSQDYIVMPLWKDGSMFDSSSKNSSDDEPQPSSNAEKKDDEGVSKTTGFSDQEQPESSTPNINTARPSINTASVNFKTGSLNTNTVSPTVITTRSNHSQNVSDMFSFGRTATHEATHVDLFGDETKMDMSNLTTSYQVPTTPNTRIHKDHSLDHVIGDIQSSVQTRGTIKNTNEHGFISAVYEGKTHEDLHTLDLPKGERAIGTKWIFMNKKDERGIVTRNKAMLVAQDILKKKMDVNSDFLYGIIEEEVYVYQPLGFEDPNYPDKVYKVYVNDIIFGSTNKELCIEFEKLMHDKFQMSSIGELNFFLGLQVKQREDRIFISQDKYVAEILRKFGFTNVRTASTPMDTEKPLLKDSDGDDVDVYLYRLMIGSLMYLTSSRPDIMFAVCACTRFQITPKVSHSHAVKRISSKRSKLWLPPSLLKLNMWLLLVAVGKYSRFRIKCWIIGLVLLSILSIWQLKRGQDTKIPQSSGPPKKVGDEAVHKELGDRIERAATTASSLEAEQDSGNINRTQSMATLNEQSP